jgi:hypothetical protein
VPPGFHAVVPRRYDPMVYLPVVYRRADYLLSFKLPVPDTRRF